MKLLGLLSMAVLLTGSMSAGAVPTHMGCVWNDIVFRPGEMLESDHGPNGSYGIFECVLTLRSVGNGADAQLIGRYKWREFIDKTAH